MMNNDVYAECLVAKIPTTGDKVKKILLLVAMVVIGAFLLLFFGILGVMLDAAILYGGYYLFTGMDKEYEYIFTNGTLDIDKISGQRSRKRMVSVDADTFTAFGKLSEAVDMAEGTTLVLASAGNGGTDYYADAKHKTAGNVRIIFTPNDKVIDGIAQFLPRQMRVKFMNDRRAELAARGSEDKEESGEE